jgi:hypothetical protein
LFQLLWFFGNTGGIKTGNSQIQNDKKQEAEIKKCKIISVGFLTQLILNCSIYNEDPNRFDEQIEYLDECEIG